MNLVSAWRMSDPVRLDGTAIMVVREWLVRTQYLVALTNAATMGARNDDACLGATSANMPDSHHIAAGILERIRWPAPR